MDLIEIDFDNMCRLCMYSDSDTLIPVFESYELKIPAKINEYLPITVKMIYSTDIFLNFRIFLD